MLAKLKFKHKDEEYRLELCQDAFSRYSARIVRIRNPVDESYWCESIIVDICESKIEVYEDIDAFGGRTLVISKEIEVDEMIEKSEGEILSHMKEFLIENYLNR